MESFRVGTDRLSVYTMSWNRPVQNRSFKAFTYEQFQTTASLSIHQEHEKFLKKFSQHIFVLRILTQNFLREQIFQSSSAILSRISPCIVSKRAWRERFWEFTQELFGLLPCGTYFLGGPVLLPLAVLYETVPSVLV